MMKPLIALSSIALSFAACAATPVSYSGDVGIALKADVVNGTVIDAKNINTESGNPYAVFISDARRELRANPGAIEIEHVDIALAGGSRVAELGQVFRDDVEVLFEMNDTGTTYVVASGTILPGITGPQELAVSFTSDIVDAAEYDKLLNGSFKVITRGLAAPGFDGKDATANLQVTFTFAAFEE